MTWRGTQNLINLYSNAPRSFERIAPADIQARRIGHFGFFREQFNQTLWPRAQRILEGMAGTVSTQA
jgi:predicted alpha/beta hydrolase